MFVCDNRFKPYSSCQQRIYKTIVKVKVYFTFHELLITFGPIITFQKNSQNVQSKNCRLIFFKGLNPANIGLRSMLKT